MMMGEGGRTSRPPIASAPTVVVVVEIAVGAPAAATAGVAAVIVVVRVTPRWSCVHGLHRDLRTWLSRGVEGLGPGVVLCPELHRGLHGDLRLLGKAMAAVGGRGAAVVWGRRVIRGRRCTIGWGRAVVAFICPIQVCMRLDLNHPIGRGTEEIQTGKKTSRSTALKDNTWRDTQKQYKLSRLCYSRCS